MKKNTLKMVALFVLTIATGKTNGQTNLHLGSYYEGGIVAYILQPADCGYDPNKQHGLLASEKDIQLAGKSKFPWCNSTSITCAFSNTVYGGIQNTALILNFCRDSSLTAAGVCATYATPELPTHWYLPDNKELKYLYNNLYMRGEGNFKPNNYWSSNETSASQAIALNFGNGNFISNVPKTTSCLVRAVHSF